MFGIPQHLQFGLTYKDHEGDIITFSSEPEYKDALLSLELNINKNIENNKGEDNNNNDDHDDIIKFDLIILPSFTVNNNEMIINKENNNVLENFEELSINDNSNLGCSQQ